jgi:hypothetical protein
MSQEAAKERSTRTPLDCHTQADSLARWKERLGGGALLLSVVWLGSNFFTSDQRDFHASRGPVAAVHQIWETECQACHGDFTPISSNSWAPPFLGDPLESSKRCQECHEGAVHHAHQTPELACGTCHREHRGRQASLVNLPDTDCTQCHKRILNHGWYDFLPTLPNVAVFSKGGHPEFSSIKADPGKIKFNHQLHLTAGMAIGKDGGTLMTLGQLPEGARKRYRDQQENKADAAPVQLACASCHQLDAGDFGVNGGKANSGAYMLPIVYGNQCQACHPLTVERDLTIPHRLEPKAIHDLLSGFFTAQVVRGNVGLLDKKVRPLPGKLPDSLDATVGEMIAKKVESAEKDLYLSKRLCAECHYFAGKSVAEAIKPGRVPELSIVPANVPTVWLKHAKFNHTAHRAVKCAECHAGTDTSTVHTDVLIPDRDSCIQCHAPVTKAGTPGARFNCTECHAYHNGDHAEQGLGAGRRNPKKQRPIDEFLLGK